MHTPIIAANWKMNGNLALVSEMQSALSKAGNRSATIIVCPPAPYLSHFELLSANDETEAHFSLGVQNLSDKTSGAYTGEISGDMAFELGAHFAIIGHSERRQLFQETDALIYAKALAAYNAGLTPIVCIGETAKERESEQTESVLSQQLDAILANQTLMARLIIAYEPVWAIGSGKAANCADIEVVHQFILQRILDANGKFGQNNAPKVPILYGGSVNEHNAADILSVNGVDGALIGGASLQVKQFLGIIECTK